MWGKIFSSENVLAVGSDGKGSERSRLARRGSSLTCWDQPNIHFLLEITEMGKTILTCIVALIISSAAQAQDTVVSGIFGANDFAVIEISVSDIIAPTYLDFDTFGSTNDDGSSADTEILLFSGLGPTAVFFIGR